METNVVRRRNPAIIVCGIVFIILSFCMYFNAAAFLDIITIVAGLSFIASAIFELVAIFEMRKASLDWKPLLLPFIADLIVGILFVAYPYVFSAVFPWLMGITFIISGVMVIIGAITARSFMGAPVFIAIISGLLSICVGVIFFIWPASMSIWISIFLFIRGVNLIICEIVAP